MLVILEVVRLTARGEVCPALCPSDALSNRMFAIQWKVFLVDQGSKRIVDCVVNEDDILQENVTSMRLDVFRMH
jgi:hypothetical protein